MTKYGNRLQQSDFPENVCSRKPQVACLRRLVTEIPCSSQPTRRVFSASYCPLWTGLLRLAVPFLTSLRSIPYPLGMPLVPPASNLNRLGPGPWLHAPPLPSRCRGGGVLQTYPGFLMRAKGSCWLAAHPGLGRHVAPTAPQAVGSVHRGLPGTLLAQGQPSISCRWAKAPPDPGVPTIQGCRICIMETYLPRSRLRG